MKKVVLTKEDIYKGDLVLINKSNSLKRQISSDELQFFNEEYPNVLINKKANRFLQFALNEINSKEKIIPVSGFRTYQEQEKIFNDSMQENGKTFTYKYVALPNTSEHQTGLAIDLGVNQENIDFIRPSFPHYGVCEKFRNISVKYGFIERYKNNKEKITEIGAEEWHFRFVGYPHSEIINNMDICLEEYINLVKKNPINYGNYEISYIPFVSPLEIELNIQDSISGNNIDGFILTRKKV